MSTQKIGGQHKVVLGTYSSYDAAQHAVDILARRDFPVDHVTIVGTGLRLEEKVIGRWSLGRAVLTSAGTGGWIGLLIGLMLWILAPRAPWVVGPAIVLGAVFGAIWGLIAYVLRRRAFASLPSIVADRYDILVDAEFADEARRVLAAALSSTEPNK
jgi:hypothetical protein